LDVRSHERSVVRWLVVHPSGGVPMIFFLVALALIGGLVWFGAVRIRRSLLHCDFCDGAGENLGVVCPICEGTGEFADW
jgi:hypothetical protein